MTIFVDGKPALENNRGYMSIKLHLCSEEYGGVWSSIYHILYTPIHILKGLYYSYQLEEIRWFIRGHLHEQTKFNTEG